MMRLELAFHSKPCPDICRVFRHVILQTLVTAEYLRTLFTRDQLVSLSFQL